MTSFKFGADFGDDFIAVIDEAIDHQQVDSLVRQEPLDEALQLLRVLGLHH